MESREGQEGKIKAAELGARAAKRVSSLFPFWKITVETASGLPARKIVAMAGKVGADLLVIGESRPEYQEPGMSIGPSSQKILTESSSSVRVARCGTDKVRPARILVGFDGSRGSTITVDEVASRPWPTGTEIRLVSAADAGVLSSIGRFAPQMMDPEIESKIVRQWSETLAEFAILKLQKAGLTASIEAEIGQASEVMVNQAQAWKADAIFIGPNCSGAPSERFLLGSVTTAVAWRAHCSVEIVRPRLN